jgi:type IV secretory pathway TraG/TraD family ATPase VirD4
VPVPSWLADSGGKGIQIITIAHGEAQLRGRWGRDGARVIMDTSGAKIWLPGISDPDTLATASTLCGTAAVRERGQDHHTRHPVMTPEMIRQLPAGRALVVRGGHSPVIARLLMCWKDPLYRAARRHRHATARPVTVTERTAALWPEPMPGHAPGDDLDDAFTPPWLGNGRHYPWNAEPS